MRYRTLGLVLVLTSALGVLLAGVMLLLAGVSAAALVLVVTIGGLYLSLVLILLRARNRVATRSESAPRALR